MSHDDLEGLLFVEPPIAQPTLNAAPSTIGGGAIRNHLSTALVKLYREIFGRGPVRTATYAFEAGYVTFLRDLLAPQERSGSGSVARISSARRGWLFAKRNVSG